MPINTLRKIDLKIIRQQDQYWFISLLIKLSIVIAAFGFIYKEIIYNKDLSLISSFVHQIFVAPTDYFLLFIVVLMMFVNWTIESLKWRFTIRKIEAIRITTALKAIFSGTSVSVFTPNRVGEFGGRIFYLNKSDRIQGVFITLLGSVSQLVVTIIAGSLGFLAFPFLYQSASINLILLYSLFGIIGILITLTLVFYFNISILTRFGKKTLDLLAYSIRNKLFKKLKNYAAVFTLYSGQELGIVLGYSMLRYVVFSTQFFLLLILFDVSPPFLGGMALITITFFTMTIIPTIALTELGVRGSVALYFIGLISSNDIGIVTASFTLWFINLAIPAIIGSAFVLRMDVFKPREQKPHKTLS